MMDEGNAVELETLLPQPVTGDLNQEAIWVLDGQDILQFNEVGALTEYLGAYPEADNDGATRLFHYSSKCNLELLVALLSKYEAWHLKMTLRSPVLRQPPTGFRTTSCACPACLGGRPCGLSGLEFSISLWQFDGAVEDQDHKLEVAGSSETFSVFAGGQKTTFRLRPWSIQLFRFPTRRVEHLNTAMDAVLYHDDFTDVACASIPLEYVLSVMTSAVRNWAIIIETSQRFLGFYSVESLNPRLETDRSIVRHLLGAAQLWKSLLSMIQAQITHLHPINGLTPDYPWLSGAHDAEQLLAAARSNFVVLTNYEVTIQQNLLGEADQLLQQMTNLITIDEGYRSRDMNESIRRLSWVTFIFLPLVFASSVFGMNLDVFQDNPAWWYYFLFTMPLVVVVSALYLGFKYSGSLAAWLTRTSSRALAAGREDSEFLVGVNTVLAWAAATGQIDTVAGLLDARGYTAGYPEAIGPGSGGALINAIVTCNEPIMRLLVQRNPQAVNETDSQGATALHHAAGRGFFSMVAFLLFHGANTSVRDGRGLSALDWAIENGDEKSTAAILQKMYEGDNTNDTPPPGATSLHIACVHGDLDMVKRLLASGYNELSRDRDGRKDAQGRIAPFTALNQGHDFFIQVATLYSDNDLKDTDYQGLGLLHVAVQLGLLETIMYLAHRGLDVNLKTAGSLDTPLHFITLAPEGTDRLAIIKFLCENGASKSLQNAEGKTIAHVIAQESRLDSANILQYLIQPEKWRLKIQDYLGRTPVHVAALSGHLPTISQLLSSANSEILSTRDRDGLMAIDLAARAGHLDSFQLLRPHLDHTFGSMEDNSFSILIQVLVSRDDLTGLQKAFTLDETQTEPLELSGPVFQQAVAARASNIISFFLSKKPVWIKYQWGPYTGTVLSHAIATGDPDLVDFLLDANAPVEGQDHSGWNALHVAAFSGLRPSTTKRIANSLGLVSLKDEQDTYGWIPYDLAYFYHREELYDILAPERLKEHILPWARKLERCQPDVGKALRQGDVLSDAAQAGGKTSSDPTELPG